MKGFCGFNVIGVYLTSICIVRCVGGGFAPLAGGLFLVVTTV